MHKAALFYWMWKTLCENIPMFGSIRGKKKKKSKEKNLLTSLI